MRACLSQSNTFREKKTTAVARWHLDIIMYSNTSFTLRCCCCCCMLGSITIIVGNCALLRWRGDRRLHTAVCFSFARIRLSVTAGLQPVVVFPSFHLQAHDRYHEHTSTADKQNDPHGKGGAVYTSGCMYVVIYSGVLFIHIIRYLFLSSLAIPFDHCVFRCGNCSGKTLLSHNRCCMYIEWVLVCARRGLGVVVAPCPCWLLLLFMARHVEHALS